MSVTNFIAVMAGGAIGALLRYIMVQWVVVNFSIKDLPLGTLLVNVIGSFLIGILAYLFINKINNEFLRIFFIIGLLGSFTTVSSFSLESVNLLLQAQYMKGFLNIGATLVLCLGATWFGLLIAKLFLS